MLLTPCSIFNMVTEFDDSKKFLSIVCSVRNLNCKQISEHNLNWLVFVLLCMCISWIKTMNNKKSQYMFCWFCWERERERESILIWTAALESMSALFSPHSRLLKQWRTLGHLIFPIIARSSFKGESCSGPGRLSTHSDKWVSMRGVWLCFGNLTDVGHSNSRCSTKSQHGSRSTRFPFKSLNTGELQW